MLKYINSIFELNKRNTLIFIALVTLWRVYLATTLQLHQDEGYYWLWSRHLALGYYDHPPMIAYFIWLTTLFSKAEFFVRLSGILVSLVLSVLAWILAKDIFKSEKVAAGSVWLINVYPMMMAGAMIITPDVPAFLFWGFSVYFAWQIFNTQNPIYWYITGACFGLSLLSKYTAVLFAPCLFLFLIFTDERRHLKTKHPYLAMMLSFIIFLPVVYWNMQHQWISFKFQLGHGLSAKSVHLLSNFFEYVGSQLLVLTPFAWLIGFVVVCAYLFSRDKGKMFLSSMSLPIIVFFGYAAVKKPGEANWPALAYFSFSIALAGYLLSETTKLKKALWLITIVTCFSITVLATLHTRFTVLPLGKINKEFPKTDATNFFYGWKELADEVKKYDNVNIIITPSHQISAMLSYYTDEKYFTYIDERLTRISQFNIWGFPQEYYGTNGLYINTDDMTLEPYKEYFKTFDTPKLLTVYRKAFPIRGYRITYGRGLIKIS